METANEKNHFVLINLLKNNFEIIQHEVSYCITASNFLVIGYLIKCALHLKYITRNLFLKEKYTAQKLHTSSSGPSIAP